MRVQIIREVTRTERFIVESQSIETAIREVNRGEFDDVDMDNDTDITIEVSAGAAFDQSEP